MYCCGKMKSFILLVFVAALLPFAFPLEANKCTGDATVCSEEETSREKRSVDRFEKFGSWFWKKVRQVRKKIYLTVTKGQVTFDSEGNDNKNSQFYSRKPHVPGRWSGVTIGRGYDFGQKSKSLIIRDLTRAGVARELAAKLAGGARLKGKIAKEFLKNNNLKNVEITGMQQKRLFAISYGRQEAEARRLTTKYYKTNWNSLNSKIQEILTDLKFRGDLLPRSHSAGQRALEAAVKANDLKKFKQVMRNRSYWKNVPKDRFDRRVKFLQK